MSKATVAFRTLLDTAQDKADDELRRCLMAGHNRVHAELVAFGCAIMVLIDPLVTRLVRLWQRR